MTTLTIDWRMTEEYRRYLALVAKLRKPRKAKAA